MRTALTEQLGIEVPLICGAMYPCSNPELVAAVSEAGGIGVVQPLSLTYVHGHDFREGLREIRAMTDKPIGLNAIVEKTARAYERRMQAWVDIALEEGVRFFVTALGNPTWVVERAHAADGVVYHDITDRRWAEKARDYGVDGLICVNRDAGGHAGAHSPAELLDACKDLGLPLVCAGGIGDPAAFAAALRDGYAGCQLGTRFIATEECRVHADYHAALLRAKPEDIVLTDKLSGVPCAVIGTPDLMRGGLRAGPVARFMLKRRRLKHWMRTLYAVRSLWRLKRASLRGTTYADVFQAGKSVGGVTKVERAGDVVARFAAAAEATALESTP